MSDESGVAKANLWLEIIQRGSWLLAAMIAGVAWGLKLESRIDTLRAELQANWEHNRQLESRMAAGILPITAERLTQLDSKINATAARVDHIESTCADHCHQRKAEAAHK